MWRGVPIPVLVIHARDDHHVAIDFAVAGAERHPGWTVAAFDRGGHHVHVTRPVEWSAQAATWLLRDQRAASPAS
jgi:pimeloyl-ACP methyl ester carboxylesterase